MANCFAIQMHAQQQVAAFLNSKYHTGWSSELAMYKGLSAFRTDHEAGSQASTCAGSSSSDSEDLSPATTLTIRNVPFSYTADWLQEELDRAGFWGKYDFLYLPSPGGRFGFKSALVNFASHSVAQEFRAMFHRGRFEHSGPQDAPLSVVVPPFQGFASCASKHPAGVVYKESAMRFVGSKPTVFMPPPGLERALIQPPIHGGPPGSWHVPPANAAAASWGIGPAPAKEEFRAMFHHGRFEHSGPQDAPLSVVVPPSQGFASCASKHPAGLVYKESAMRFVGSKPTVFMPPPGVESALIQPPIHGGPPGSWHVPPPPAAASWSIGPAQAKEQCAEKRRQWVGTSPADALLPRCVGSAREAAELGEVEAFYISL